MVVDSMQVYSGIREISNQARDRAAELVAVVPVTERWSVARHAEAAKEIIAGAGPWAVLDAGTGMYLNAILLDVPMAPRVPDGLRREAERATVGERNPRRASREFELGLYGAPGRGSIWDGDLLYDTTLLYARPDRAVLDASISLRSRGISERGVDEARAIRSLQRDGLAVNPSVLEAVGVKEMLMVADGELAREAAAERIAARTRRLARRQIRWFDKLASTLEGRANVVVSPAPEDADILHVMHGIVGE